MSFIYLVHLMPSEENQILLCLFIHLHNFYIPRDPQIQQLLEEEKRKHEEEKRKLEEKEAILRRQVSLSIRSVDLQM